MINQFRKKKLTGVTISNKGRWSLQLQTKLELQFQAKITRVWKFKQRSLELQIQTKVNDAYKFKQRSMMLTNSNEGQWWLQIDKFTKTVTSSKCYF